MKVIATAASSDRALEPEQVLKSAAQALPGAAIELADSVGAAVRRAVDAARDEDEAVVIAGSLYVAGEARTLLV